MATTGKTLVCDVNGWSFVKKSSKYYDDCASLLAELMERRRVPQQRGLFSRLPSAHCLANRSGPAFLYSSNDGSTRRPSSSDVASKGTGDGRQSKTSFPSAGGLGSRETSRSNSKSSGRELRCVIAVVRHGDRTPKRKLKVRVRHPKLVAVHTNHAKGSEKIAAVHNEAKIRESRDLREVAEIVRSVLDEDDARRNSDDKWLAALAQLRDVLEQHIPVVPKDPNSQQSQTTLLNTALFSGCKLQLKPSAWAHDEAGVLRVTEVILVLKWGGVLTELGVEHACQLGAHFRRHMYPASGDGAGLLRLHATFRHDLKIRTSDEGAFGASPHRLDCMFRTCHEDWGCLHQRPFRARG